MDFEIFIRHFQDVNVAIVKNLTDTSLRMIYYMIMIDITLTFLFVEEEGLNVLVKLMRKILVYGFFIYVIKDFANIVDTILHGFIQLGNLAVTGNATKNLVVSPGQVFNDLGAFITSVLLISGSVVTLDGIPVVSIESVPTAMLIFGFSLALGALLIGIEVTISFVKFFVVTATSVILMPFGAFQKTQDIAMKGLHALFAQGIEIMFMTIILNFYDKYKGSLFSPPNITENIEVLGFISTLATLICLVLIMTKIPVFVSTLLSGSISSLGVTGSRKIQSGANSMARMGGNAVGGMNFSKEFNMYTKNSGAGIEGVKGIENKK